MHRVSNEGLTMYDSSLTEQQKQRIRGILTFHLITWVLNVGVVAYLSYFLFNKFESVFMGYTVFSVFSLLASIAYARRYKSWYGRNILVYFILFIFIIVNFVLFFAVGAAHFLPQEQFQKFRRGKDEWYIVGLRLLLFFIPVVHSL